MPQSLARVAIHLIFSTKHRAPYLKDPQAREELAKYMATVFQGVDSSAIEINSVEDHLHALFCLSRKHALAAVVEEIKTETSKWIKRRFVHLAAFRWQAGYGAFSVSESKIEEVQRYIQRQEEHHRQMTFQEEWREICRRHGVAIDERYTWD